MELTTEVLRTLPPQDLATHLPAVVGMGDGIGVILRLVDTDLLEVFYAGRFSVTGIRVLEIEPVHDSGKQLEAMRTTTEALAICRRVALEKHAEQRAAHTAQLEAIRQYAIEAHEDGSICRDGLDSFLNRFDLMPYCTRIKVSYSISGSYEVESGSGVAAQHDAEKYLQPDLTGLDDVDDDTNDYDVTVDEIEEV
ncbi:hypothetical protein BGM19_26755 [Streptomyces agglomeratus]|uniref:hypothetical protein n=1 Tax=Streptomyces agglomeratus TaxID=285458 RepID=UPI00086ACEEF|nr:hypothetical protein [Streptomyces agglomeratus]OEJ61077.1 hypothetical protein BGM19_26755 [Streptomyces agglomeratus]